MSVLISLICRRYFMYRYHRNINGQLIKCITIKNLLLCHIHNISFRIRQNVNIIARPKSSNRITHCFEGDNPKWCYFSSTTTNLIYIEANNGNIQEDKINKTIKLIKNDIHNLKRISVTDVNTVHELLKLAGSCNKEQSTFLIKCCGKLLPSVHPEKRSELLLSVWKTFKHLKTPITSDHYQVLLTILAENKHAVSVKDVLLEMEDDGVLLDERLCLSLLHCVCEVGHIEQANHVIELMTDLKLLKNQPVLDFILLGYGRARNAKAVEDFISTNKGKFSPSVLLKIFAEAGKADKFKSYANEATLTEDETLDIVISLAVGNLVQLIPDVVQQITWSEDGITKARNTSIELIHFGYPEAGLVLLAVLEKYWSHDDNLFSCYIVQLLKSNTEINKVIQIFIEMAKIDYKNLLAATHCALKLEQKDVSIQLLKEIKRKGYPIRPHYFWPLILSENKINGKQGVFKIIDIMTEMEVKLDFDTIRNYILPRISFVNMIDLVQEFRHHGLLLVDVLTPAMHFLLMDGKIEVAVELSSAFKGRMDWKLLMEALAQYFIKTGNISSTISLLQLAPKTATNILVQNIKVLQKPSQSQNLNLLLQALEDKTVNQHNGVRTYIPHPKNMTLEELECHLLELKGKNLNTRGVLRKLLQLHCRFGNVQRANEIKNELRDAGCVLSVGMMASLFQLYIATENEKEAEKCLKNIEETYPNFKLDSYKIVDFATLLVNKHQYSKALVLIEVYKGDGSNMERNCKRLVDAVATIIGINEAKQILNMLFDRHYTKISNNILSSLINVQLERNDLKEAVQAFVNCEQTYKKTPMLYSLLRALCKNQDCDLLEKVLKIGRQHHGLINTNIMYVMALAESNQLSQLIEFVQSPHFRIDTDKLFIKCQHFVDIDNAQALENIITALVKVSSYNVEPIYFMILQICVKQENADAALELWTTMQEFKIIPSENFSKNFKLLLHKCNRSINLK